MSGYRLSICRTFALAPARAGERSFSISSEADLADPRHLPTESRVGYRLATV